MRPTKLFHTIVVLGASLGAAAGCGGDDDGMATDGGAITADGSTSTDGGTNTDSGLIADASVMLDAMMASDAGLDDGGEEDGMVLIL